MSEDLRGQLQSSLGTTYTIERELGGGGMSRTFVAHETSLNRRVVVKVLTPDLAAGVSVDRFKREIQLSAALQHPHIVPVLAAGDSSGLPYYTMPFVDGESLRMRLSRGALPITETIGILRDVARALAFAHAHGVVHRDIKPDNVLLSGGSATVADFGIAKAISAARTNPSDATLTQLGTALGTPAYMAPEQAAGDPSTDHRADLYAFGVLAYELLAGRAPFHGLTPQRLLAAHMGEKPKLIGALRPDAPPALADLVMRCLEKDANARPQSASDIARFLDTVTSSTGQSAAPAVLLGGRVSLTKALALYAAAFVVVVVLAKAAIVGIGLPDWVFPTAIGVMVLGLPAILFTAYVQRATHRALVATPTLTPGGTPVGQGTMATMAIAASPHVSWRRTAMGGVGAVGALILLTAAWMVMRAAGIGPAASLMSAGKLGERDKIIIADFKSPPTDSVLGPTVTDAFRTDLAQSRNLSIMPANAVREVLRRMQRPPTTTVDFALAREVATREGIKAVVDGEVVALGGSYVLSARLVSAQNGEELGSFRETANEAKDIIPAIGRLSKDLRSKVGESLKTIQAARTLDKVTTPSLEALQKYVQGARALETENDWNRGRTLLEEAIAIDTGFAMAYRKLAVEHANRGSPASIFKALVKKAFDHRDRLSDAERYITIGSYYTFGPEVDRTKAISAYESLLDLDPDNVTALNNLSEHLRNQKNFVRAEELGMHAIEVQPTAAVFYENTFGAQVALGKLDAAAKTLDIARKNIPRNFAVARMRSNLALNRGEFDSAARIIDSVRVARQGDVAARSNTEFFLSAIAGTRGRLAESLRHLAVSHAADREFGSPTVDIDAATDSAVYFAFHLNRPDEGARILDRALASHPLDSIAIEDRPLTALIEAYTLAKRPDRAKTLLTQLDRRISVSPLLSDDQDRVVAGGQIALAEGRYADAIRDLRAANATGCVICRWPEIGRAYDAAGQPDSAIAAFERYVNGYAPARIISDVNGLASSMLRTAELYDAKGNAEKAASYYARFVDLWKDADPELQPTVKKARDRLQQLQRKTG